MRKVAFFDFCETLVDFQTADAYVDYVRKGNGNLFMRFLEVTLRILNKARIIAIINKLFPDLGFSKRFKLIQLRGFSYEKLNTLAEAFYNETVKPKMITPVLMKMAKHAQQGFEIGIVSAGYSIYLKYFAEEYQIKHLISTNIAFNSSGTICRGLIRGKDCINREKVSRLKEYFKDSNIDFNDCISYSDSISDLPMLLLTGEGVVVSKVKSQGWSHQYRFKEIIWN